MGSPLYEGLAAQLREQINTGTLAPGGRLPSEAELQTEHKVSRHTVRQALALLSREGLVISGQGRGWYVRESKPLTWHAARPEHNLRTDVSPADAWALDVREQGGEPTERIAVSIVAAEPRIAARLKLGAGELVVVRRRVRYVDGEICMLADTYYPHDIAGGTPIAQPGDVLPGVWSVMEQLGYQWDDTRRTDEIRSRPASYEEAEVFAVEPGHPMTEVYRTRRTSKGRPVALATMTFPGDRITIEYSED